MMIKDQNSIFFRKRKKVFCFCIDFSLIFTFSLNQRINNLYFCNKNEPMLLFILFKLSGTLSIICM